MSWTHMMHPRHFSLIFQAQEVATAYAFFPRIQSQTR